MNNFQIVNSSEVLPTWKSLENHPTVAHQLVKKLININLKNILDTARPHKKAVSDRNQ